MLTRHCQSRSQSRGIPRTLIETVLRHHDACVFVGDGCQSRFITRNKLERMVSSQDLTPQQRDKINGLVVVVASDGTAITTMKPSGRREARYRRAFKTRKKMSNKVR